MKSPVVGFTEPPPKDAAYRPYFVLAIISSFVDVPLPIKVLDIREVGSNLYDSLLQAPFPFSPIALPLKLSTK